MEIGATFSLSMNSPRNQLGSLIMHEQSARLLFETWKLPRDMYSKQRVAIPSLLFQSRLPLPGDCTTEAFPLFSKLSTASSRSWLYSPSSFAESKFALHGKTRRNPIHISRMIHLCSPSRLFINKRGSSEARPARSKS